VVSALADQVGDPRAPAVGENAVQPFEDERVLLRPLGERGGRRRNSFNCPDLSPGSRTRPWTDCAVIRADADL